MSVGKAYKIWWYPCIGQGKIVKFFFTPSSSEREKRLLASEDSGTKSDDDVVESYCGKMAESLSRTRSRIFELAGCNPWDWFFTGTLNPQWHDTGDLNGFRKALTQYIRDVRKKAHTPCHFLLIPEQHKSGAWHIHGLLYGFPPDCFRSFTLGEKLPISIINALKKGDDIREWVGYSKKFGYTTVSPIRSQERTTSYITKYITKDCFNSAIANGNHLYYCSRGLQGKQLLYEGRFLPAGLGNVKYSFENDYVAISDIFELPANLGGGNS